MDDEQPALRIAAPAGLHYPITVTKLSKAPGDQVARSEQLFTYFYESTVKEGNKWGESHKVKRRFHASFVAAVDGVVEKWHIQPNSVVPRAGFGLVEIKEPCTHETQFGGLCVMCGKDMTEVDYLTKDLNSKRATINMTHDNVALLVSHNEARKTEDESKKRLLKSQKLSLIVDLDQTVIHTTCERTIADWKADPSNPNYEAVKDVEGFQLADDNVAHVAANWYYVKMRPGLQGFLDRMSQLYEMHIYTMATRAYAQAVARIIDPDRKYFGDRILSRDENYTDKLKSLHRLFPNNTDMVVIIDDRADIWQYSEHLVRVPVFNFFPGAGDINASFLPKQQELVISTAKPKSDPAAKAKAKDEKESGSVVSVATKPPADVPPEAMNGVKNELEQQMITMGVGESPEALEEQVKEQEKLIVTQLTERPLLQQQIVLDKEDEVEEAEKSEAAENGDAQPTEPHKHRSLLHDDDRGLDIVEANLLRVHRAFYDEYQRSKVAPKGGRVAELKGERSPRKPLIDGIVPDVAELMPRLKGETLAGCVIVFSGIIPVDQNVEQSDFALWIKSFGAKLSLVVNKHTTHVIANPDRRTDKVKRAARILHEGGNIQIVTVDWMFQCVTRWEHVDEEPYYIDVEDERRASPLPLEELGDVTGEEDLDSPVPLDMSDDNWDSINKEMQEFMDESDDTDGNSASDSESVDSTKSTQSDAKPTKRKRKRGTESNDEGEDSDSSVNSTSRLQRRKKRTMERVTSLTNVVNADKSSGLPSPETTGPEEEQGDDDGDKIFDPQGEGTDLADDNDQGLEDEVLAAFENADDDE